MQRRAIMRSLALAAIGFAAGVGVLGFSTADPSTSRPGLEAYRSDAMRAVDPTEDLAKHSNVDIASVMEARNLCRELYRYSRGKASDPEALKKRLWEGAARIQNAPGEAAGGNIDALVQFAVTRVDASRKEGSMAPVEDFFKTECNPKQDIDQPILTADGG